MKEKIIAELSSRGFSKDSKNNFSYTNSKGDKYRYRFTKSAVKRERLYENKWICYQTLKFSDVIIRNDKICNLH